MLAIAEFQIGFTNRSKVMPVQIIPLSEAFASRKTEYYKWPRDEDSQSRRLSPIARPAFETPFRIAKADKIFTVGSCFARNIEKQLDINGYDYAAKDFSISIDECDFHGELNSLLNKYVVHSILNEFQWALDPESQFSEDNYIRMPNDTWWDPHLMGSVRPSSMDRVRVRRQKILNYFAKAKDADVVIITLGLVEAWFDTKTGLYGNGSPPGSITKTEPNRFEFHVLDYNQILAALDDIHSLFERFGKPGVKIIITVSPIALGTTFTGQDCLVANCYSKSVQRAAVGAFVAKHENVTYFPSYESVTLSDRRRAWEPDQIHASDEIVRYNVLTMMSSFTDTNAESYVSTSTVEAAAEAFRFMHEAETHVKIGNISEANRLYEAAIAVGPDEGHVLMQFANFLVKQKKSARALEVAIRSIERGSGLYGGHAILWAAHRMNGNFEEAYVAIKEAVVNFPQKMSNRHALAITCLDLGKQEEAMQAFEYIITNVRQSKRSTPVIEKKYVDGYIKAAKTVQMVDRAEKFLMSSDFAVVIAR